MAKPSRPPTHTNSRSVVSGIFPGSATCPNSTTKRVNQDADWKQPSVLSGQPDQLQSQHRRRPEREHHHQRKQ
jgi:hypothetical protein